MILMPINSWTSFKTTVLLSKGLGIQFSEYSDRYEVYAAEAGTFTWSICILKDGGSDVTDFETNYKSKANKSVLQQSPPFAAKVLPNGKKLYTRVHGIQASVSGAPDNIDFVIPYDNCKITGLEIIGGNTGDTISLKVLDTPTGTISGIADYMLNQFGFDVNVSKDFYKRDSAYDADLIKDMKIRIEYDSIATLPALVYINLIIHEVKD